MTVQHFATSNGEYWGLPLPTAKELLPPPSPTSPTATPATTDGDQSSGAVREDGGAGSGRRSSGGSGRDDEGGGGRTPLRCERGGGENGLDYCCPDVRATRARYYLETPAAEREPTDWRDAIPAAAVANAVAAPARVAATAPLLLRGGAAMEGNTTATDSGAVIAANSGVAAAITAGDHREGRSSDALVHSRQQGARSRGELADDLFFLPLGNLTLPLWELHVGAEDCTHMCLPPFVWEPSAWAVLQVIEAYEADGAW